MYEQQDGYVVVRDGRRVSRKFESLTDAVVAYQRRCDREECDIVTVQEYLVAAGVA